MTKSRLNLTLFRKIRNRILRVPEAYDQSVWGAKSRKAPCGTRACIAGNALIESGFCTPRELLKNERGETDEYFDIKEEAQELLGITHSEASILFTPCPRYGWPEPFQTRWNDAKNSTERARVAADYLNHIIKTGKVLQ
jgi:hypothetical protein